MNADITQKRLRELLSYDPEIGDFTWIKRTSNRVQIGHVASYVEVNGYNRIHIDGKPYKAHRLAWLYVYGVWPKNEIDHRDGDRMNNRLANLRECTRQENTKNQGIRNDNKSGYKGVSWHVKAKKWMAQIASGRAHFYLGLFNDARVAHAAYERKAIELFGEFKRE